jgi:hypothetical protein
MPHLSQYARQCQLVSSHLTQQESFHQQSLTVAVVCAAEGIKINLCTAWFEE